jgi:DNA-binding response OmpR family regulator
VAADADEALHHRDVADSPITEMRKARPDAKIIAISGGGRIGNTDFLKIARVLGAMDVIPKPFDPDELRCRYPSA